MEFLRPRFRYIMALVCMVLPAACQGNMGTTPPVQPGGQYTPGGQMGALSAMRQSVSANASVTLAPDTVAVNFPPVAGFGIVLQLHSPSPTPTPIPTAMHMHRKFMRKKPSPSPVATVALSPSPVASASLEPAPGRKRKGSGTAAVSTHLADLVLTVYPDDAPNAPTAPPSMPPILIRHALLRGEVHAQDAFTLPSLNALSFILAKREQLAERAFTVAVIEEHKHKKIEQLAVDMNATMDAGGVVRSALTSPVLRFAANHRYVFVLYAEDLAPPVPQVKTVPSGLTSTPSASPTSTGGLFSGSTLQGGVPH
jgi:hypothetical protein